MNTPYVFKRCTKCGETLPATTEYFYKAKNGTIIDKIKYKEEYAKDKIEKYEKAHISTGANIELVYCPECGKAYAKGEEPCMCKCGYIFSRPQIK